MTKEQKFHKALKYMSITTLLLTLILIGLVTYWTCFPFKTIDFKKDYQTIKDTYYQGDETAYLVDYCKYSDVMPTVVKKFVDGIEFTAEANRPILQSGCKTELVPLKIPATLPAGYYRLFVYLDYKINPLRTIHIEHHSNWFKVLEKE